MDPNHLVWNQQQKALAFAVTDPARHGRAVDLFLDQHAVLHAPEVSGSGLWSLDAEIWQGLSEKTARRIPPGADNSIAWKLWHIARIEDITMNYLLAGAQQLFAVDGWRERLGASAGDTGNAMDPVAIDRLSAEIDLPALRAYRSAVGQRTRAIVRQLDPGTLIQPVDRAALARIAADGAVLPDAGWVLEYWGSKTRGTLLLMPPTRHLFVHLNEAARLKARRG